MKKRLTLLLLSSLLIVPTFNPIMVRGQDNSSNNQVINNVGGNASGKLNSKQRLNNNAATFTSIVSQAEQSIGSDRVLLLLSSGLGVSLQTLQAEFAIADLSLGNFVLAQIIARQQGVSTIRVINLFNQNMPVGSIANQLGVAQGLFLPIMKSFARALRTEISVNNGTLQPDAQRDLRIFRRTLNSLNNNFNQFSTSLGNDVFNSLLIEQLSLQTGLSINQINSLRANLSTDVTNSQFAIALLTASSIASITTNGSINNINLNLLTNAAGIQSALITNTIPFHLFTSRVGQFDSDFFTAAGSINTVAGQTTTSTSVFSASNSAGNNTVVTTGPIVTTGTINGLGTSSGISASNGSTTGTGISSSTGSSTGTIILNGSSSTSNTSSTSSTSSTNSNSIFTNTGNR